MAPLTEKIISHEKKKHRSAIECNNYAVAELLDGNIHKAYSLLTESCENMLYQQQRVGDGDQHTRRRHAISSPPEVYRFGWIDCTAPITRKLQKDEVYSTRSQDTSSTCFMYFKLVTIVDSPPPPLSGMPHHAGIGNPSCPCGFAWAVWYK
jgi:hypothetical protein